MKAQECVKMPVGLNKWHLRHTCSRPMEWQKERTTVYVQLPTHTSTENLLSVLCCTCNPGKVVVLVLNTFITTDLMALFDCYRHPHLRHPWSQANQSNSAWHMFQSSGVKTRSVTALNVHVLHISGFISYMNMTNKKWTEEESSGKNLSTAFSGEKKRKIGGFDLQNVKCTKYNN